MTALSGKVAIVTGAADGMGRRITERFAEEGARVVATDINLLALEQAFKDNSSVITVATDITSLDAPDRLIGIAEQSFSRVDILVNAAGIFQFVEFEHLSLSQWDRMMDVNLNAPFRLCMRALPALKACGSGRIINIASTNALRARKGMGCYTVSKHGMAGLTISLAVELGEFGITANYINPGCIITGITRTLMDDPKMEADMKGQGVLNRLGTVDEIAQAALYLAGPNSGFTTGHGLAVDGGFLIKYPDRLAE